MINAAAYAPVDQAEAEESLAVAVNGEGPATWRKPPTGFRMKIDDGGARPPSLSRAAIRMALEAAGALPRITPLNAPAMRRIMLRLDTE